MRVRSPLKQQESQGFSPAPDRSGLGDRRLVHWLCWQPTPYNDFLFRRLSREVPLLVHFRERVLPSHPWKTPLGEGYPARLYKRRFGVDWSVAMLPLRDQSSLYVVGGWDHPTAWILLSLLRLLRRRYVIWTDTPRLAARRHPVRAAVRGWLLRLVVPSGAGHPGNRASGDEGA